MNVRIGTMTCKITNRIEELLVLVSGLFFIIIFIITCANLSALDGHLGVA